MYKSIICEPTSLEEVLDDINQQDMEIVGCFYLSDSWQVCLIVESEEKAEKPIGFLGAIKGNLRGYDE